MQIVAAQAPAATPNAGPVQGARGGAPVLNPNSVSPVEFLIDPPTLMNLGFEWFIQGDENRNATVAVSYRKKGETAWKPALPMCIRRWFNGGSKNAYNTKHPHLEF